MAGVNGIFLKVKARQNPSFMYLTRTKLGGKRDLATAMFESTF